MGKEKFKIIPIFGEYQITHNAYIDYVDLVSTLTGWFDDRKYDFFEQKRKEKDNGVGFEIESVWVATRDIDHYVQFEILMKIFVRDLRKVVLEDGKETYWARTVVRINSNMKKNYRETFKGGWWNETLRQFYERYIVRERMDAFEGKIVEDSMELVNHVKAHLK